MNKYKLFSEHRNLELYGNTPEDALLSVPAIPRADKYIPPSQSGKMYGEKPIADYGPREDIRIKSIVGTEDTGGSRRGDKQYVRLVCDTSIGRIAIDMEPLSTPINAM